jgi:hypothetical protein
MLNADEWAIGDLYQELYARRGGGGTRRGGLGGRERREGRGAKQNGEAGVQRRLVTLGKKHGESPGARRHPYGVGVHYLEQCAIFWNEVQAAGAPVGRCFAMFT